MKVPISDGKFTPLHFKKIKQVLSSNRLTYGPMTELFEKRWANLHNCKYALFCNSGTSALQVAIHAMKIKYGWKDGDGIIVPAITFPATINAVIHNNLIPYLVDVSSKHFDLERTAGKWPVSSLIKAILPVHMFGQPAKMKEVMAFANWNKMSVIEDSCEAVGVNYHARPVGSFGNIACFSTYFSHIISTGVGGMITTNDDELISLCKSLIYHGRDQIYLKMDDDDNLDKEGLFKLIPRRFRFKYPGYSFRATEMEAALGLVEFDGLFNILAKRYDNASLYQKLLEDLPQLVLPRPRHNSEHAWMFYPMMLKKKYEADRDKLVNFLEENGIETRFLMPIIGQPVYEKFGWLPENFPNASRINRRGFLVGCHQYLTGDQIKYVSDKIHEFFKSG